MPNMQMQLDVTANQGFSEYAEHLIMHVMQHSRKDRQQAIKYLDQSASKYWRCKVAEFKKYQDLEV